ncbi:ABC transporter substrate-binding protein [Dongia sp.]|uniref:ABC transporter substrate-binding protein n=1 Tax=Dongia sp. TaxID=1977262 RepID=UPI0035B03F33
MLPVRILAALILAFGVALSAPRALRADIQHAAAATYIRTLVETSLGPDLDTASLCPQVSAFGRFAAGHAWQALPGPERSRFAQGFCALALDAVGRLRAAYPGLRLDLGEVGPGAQGMVAVDSQIARPGLAPWRVNWLVAADGNGLRLADLKILGISLGIFLRSLVTLQAQPHAPQSVTAEYFLTPWRRALDRAFPPLPGRPAE